MIIEKAQKIIEERQKEYGDINKTFESVARAFNEICLPRQGLCAQDVALIQVLLKLKRAQSSPTKMDHYIDIAGYAEILARLA